MIGEGIPLALIIILAIIACGAVLFVAATLFYFNELEKGGRDKTAYDPRPPTDSLLRMLR